MYRYPYNLRPGANKTQVCVLVENAMGDAAATGALHTPLVASSSGQRPANDTNASPVVPAIPTLGEALGTVAAASSTAMRKVVEFEEMGWAP